MGFTMKHLGGGTSPAHMHGGNHGIDPAKKKAEAQASKNLTTSKKVYEGGSRSMVDNPDGTRTLTSTRNYTQSGTGKDRNLPSYASVGVSKAEGDAYWAKKSKRGVETESITSVNLKPYGIVQSKTSITGGTQVKVTPPKPKPDPKPKPKPNPKPKPKPKKPKSYIVQDTGRAIGDAGRSVAEGVSNAVSNLGYAFSRRGVVGSLFNCRTCGR